MGIVTRATVSLQSILGGETGLSWALSDAATGIPNASAAEIRIENVSIEVAEKSLVRYPAVLVYCEKLSNTLKEKFAVLSGTMSLGIEIRASGNSIAAVSEQSRAYAEAVMKVLDCHLGQWADGIQYCGGYEIGFQQMKRGGTQLIQVTRITVPVQISQR